MPTIFHRRKKKGFEDEENGGVSKHILRFITECFPNAFLLENVDYIRHHNKGKTLKSIIDSLEKPGVYNVQYKVINTEDQGIPQIAKECTFVEYSNPVAKAHSPGQKR